MALDFNLLPALEILLEERSVVRAGRGLVPRPRALELRDRVRVACQEVRSLLGPSGPWAPRTVDRTFTLRFSDSLVEAWGPA